MKIMTNDDYPALLTAAKIAENNFSVISCNPYETTHAWATKMPTATTTFSSITKRTHKSRSIIDHVLFNGPATIIFFKDGTKSIVKCQEGDTPDREKGFVMAYLKHELGGDNQFNYEIRRWVKQEDIAD